jgi:3-oxoacyl-[acyl-carrier protein] reductase
MTIEGLRFIVAGGCGHLGQAIVKALLEKGAVPLVLDQNAPPEGFPDAQCWGVEALDESSIRRAMDDVDARVGQIDGLVNAIGRMHSAPLWNITASPRDRLLSLSEFDGVLRDNLHVALTIGAAVVERMIRHRRKGAVINIGSVVARGNAGQSAYSASKAGVHALTMTWAMEFAGLGLRFVTIEPGFVETPSMRSATPEHVINQIVRETLSGRLVSPEEIAHAVIFALENASLNATRLRIDGGLV